MRTLKI